RTEAACSATSSSGRLTRFRPPTVRSSIAPNPQSRMCPGAAPRSSSTSSVMMPSSNIGLVDHVHAAGINRQVHSTLERRGRSGVGLIDHPIVVADPDPVAHQVAEEAVPYDLTVER